MKRSFPIFCICFLFLSGVVAQETIQVPWANKFFVPKDTPPVIVHDFGTVPNGTIVTQRFSITNLYAVKMQIVDVRVSCGCVSSSLPKKILEPLENSFIDLTMDLRKFPSQNKAVTVWVDFGPQYRSSAVLQVRAQSRGDFNLRPGNIDFGIIPQGQKASQMVELQYTGGIPDWQITGIVKNDNSPLEVIAQQTSRQRGPIVYKITASLKENATAGSLQEVIQLQTNDQANPIIPISVIGTLKAPFTVSPNPIRFEVVRIGETKPMNVIVSGSKPFKIKQILGEGEGLSATPTRRDENRVQAIAIKFQPTQVGEIKRRLTIVTDKNEEIPIIVEGTAQ